MTIIIIQTTNDSKFKFYPQTHRRLSKKFFPLVANTKVGLYSSSKGQGLIGLTGCGGK